MTSLLRKGRGIVELARWVFVFCGKEGSPLSLLEAVLGVELKIGWTKVGVG